MGVPLLTRGRRPVRSEVLERRGTEPGTVEVARP
jgi:hypothetical protein